MKIVYMHLHLKHGGVTTVILQQVAAIREDCEVLVISGEDPESGFPAPHVRIDGLAYDDPDFPEKRQSPHTTAAAIASAIYDRWPEGCDVIHVHNPLLAKNMNLLKVLDLLRKEGFNLFLQIHDFAEDGRPESYYNDQEYPADCHYGTINSRDSRILETSGLHPDGVHELFNMVNPLEKIGICGKSIPCALYPVRAIRRKNIGEALLLSLYFPAGTPLAITLPPNSPIDHVFYQQWIAFVEKHKLNVIFEASSSYDFKALISDARFFVTTSITEGFGFAFLEPWTAGKMLIGRKLPDICRDFTAKGINLDHLYENLNVPTGWIDPNAFEYFWQQCIRTTFDRYSAKPEDSLLIKGFEHFTQNGLIDFSMLGETFQRSVLDRLIEDRAAYNSFKNINPVLSGFGLKTSSLEMIESNCKAVLTHYDKKAYRKRLLEIYKKVQPICVKQKIDKKILLRQFLQPESFSLMKWCDNGLS